MEIPTNYLIRCERCTSAKRLARHGTATRHGTSTSTSDAAEHIDSNQPNEQTNGRISKVKLKTTWSRCDASMAAMESLAVEIL